MDIKSYRLVKARGEKARLDQSVLSTTAWGAQNRKNVSGQKQSFSNSKQHTNPTVSKTMYKTCSSKQYIYIYIVKFKARKPIIK